MAKGFIFDVDGTILDSMEIWMDAAKLYLKDLGIEAEENLGDIMFSLTMAEGAEYIRKTIEYARNVCGIKDANSLEFDELCKNPVINLMSDQSLEDMGGTQRLGDYECQLNPGTHAYRLYGKEMIKERHRHRYEFNNNYKDVLVENGLKVAGFNPERNLVEIVELEDHPYYVGCQFHPEFTSRPNRAQPLFQGLISAAHDRKYNK